MAMDDPRPRIVKLEGYGEITVARQSRNVTTRWVRQVEDGCVAVVHAGVCGQHEEVVAVQMDGVRDTESRVILNDQHNELRRSHVRGPFHSDDVVVEGEFGLAAHHLLDGRVLPVELQAAAVEGPLEPAAAGAKAQRLSGDLVEDAHVQRQVWDKVRRGFVFTVLSLGDGADGGRLGSAGAIVPNDASDTVWVEVVAAGGVPFSTEPIVPGGSVRFDDYIVALTNAQAQGFCGVGNDRNEIVADDSEIVVVDRKLEVSVGGRVYHPEAILLASLEDSLPFGSITQTLGVRGRGAVVGVRAVYESIFHSRRPTSLGSVPQSKRFSVAPVVEKEHTEVLIVVSRGWTVQDQASESTLCVLQTEMTMIPGGAILGSLELVSLRATRRHGAFSDTRHAVVVTAIELPQAVPMNSSAVALEIVSDVNLESVTPVGL